MESDDDDLGIVRNGIFLCGGKDYCWFEVFSNNYGDSVILGKLFWMNFWVILIYFNEVGNGLIYGFNGIFNYV